MKRMILSSSSTLAIYTLSARRAGEPAQQAFYQRYQRKENTRHNLHKQDPKGWRFFEQGTSTVPHYSHFK